MAMTRRQVIRLIAGGTAAAAATAGGIILFTGPGDQTGETKTKEEKADPSRTSTTGKPYQTNTAEMKESSFGDKDFNAGNSMLRLKGGREILFIPRQGIGVEVLSNDGFGKKREPLPRDAFSYLGIDREESIESTDPLTQTLTYETATGKVLAFTPTSRRFLKTDLQAKVHHVTEEQIVGQVKESEYDADLLGLEGVPNFAYTVHQTGAIMLVTNPKFGVDHSRGGLVNFYPGKNGMIYEEVPAKVDPSSFGKRLAQKIEEAYIPTSSD